MNVFLNTHFRCISRYIMLLESVVCAHFYLQIFYVVSLPKPGAHRIIPFHLRNPLTRSVLAVSPGKMMKPGSTVDIFFCNDQVAQRMPPPNLPSSRRIVQKKVKKNMSEFKLRWTKDLTCQHAKKMMVTKGLPARSMGVYDAVVPCLTVTARDVTTLFLPRRALP